MERGYDIHTRVDDVDEHQKEETLSRSVNQAAAPHSRTNETIGTS